MGDGMSYRIKNRTFVLMQYFQKGGGHSALSPALGLGVDRVLQFKIVTPDGKYRTVNKCQDSDLFFALRGGGGGTFGVVLESTFMASPPMTLEVYVYFCDCSLCPVLTRQSKG